jgi:DNA-binding transcriptional regulator PaaX
VPVEVKQHCICSGRQLLHACWQLRQQEAQMKAFAKRVSNILAVQAQEMQKLRAGKPTLLVFQLAG